MESDRVAIKDLWEKCRVEAQAGKDPNSGGLGRMKIGGKVYVGGFYLNLVMLHDGKQGYALSENRRDAIPVDGSFDLTPAEFVNYINR